MKPCAQVFVSFFSQNVLMPGEEATDVSVSYLLERLTIKNCVYGTRKT